jgi:SMI1 / KNR4 family (SUKH-1)
MIIDYSEIREMLRKLRASSDKARVFGANGHGFEVNEPLTETEVEMFERKYRITLPEDYRGFLIHVGNGGAGPAYGIFRLGEMDDIRDFARWEENDGFVGVLSEPFPHTEAWNDLTDAPNYDFEDYAEIDRQVEAFEKNYFDVKYVNGAIPICHIGCALRRWLVVTGPERGHIWCDDRADQTGLYPLQLPNADRVTFIDWYLDWLRDAQKRLFRNKRRD